MTTTTRFTALLMLTVGMPGMSQAVDLKAGQALHDAKCVQCHGNEVYTRSDRRVSSLDALRQQVHTCEGNAKLTWSDDDIENVVQYLNATYYKFK